ncbi:MAG: Trigger factor [Candidatus Uhrbacteria bacterium GW2011_GWD2_41_121]|uniref:Trigger factor n=1 Tax=Candidatus Uhrbacteria bacterium GW2011_GWC1_41_20 TaxID=1618983 RepID=A0A0G0XRH7_9BACT|nr:MAG: Trigger factor [Candidatus Uhrbacteria bacterium GW2011_GWE1_39_46]KKR64168.1 MAG: Trigger factor [Candidatus Uhrbacteria bacterium GW2011_GWC2_40_450]KKR90303.1 MAG: Trigger factor [Candidatus Uhrbacteria bacterium GW2011_GWD2_41_121]KKR95983.1 MAG: Trigger factor [Candidatus Uhrbacteria bacterium GW2011_GWD1_41_16]KKR99525.1 MAG: Trigger factor [Candidatus Uhrbacteria bacterium GW2011_GWC1_41_20]KKS06176.1 MAG: Trigger factor [Candidatus Uhrbacteria bacterium GW2011_GWB2_41_36]KKS08
MSYTVSKDKNKVTFSITIPVADVEAGMRDAAERISKNTNIPGFRPGKADYESIKTRVGEMAILEEATEGLVREAFIHALIEEKIETVGQPYFNMTTMAPGNDLVFTAEVSLMPEIKKLADYTKKIVTKKDTKPTKELLNQAKKDLSSMQTKEVRAPKGEELKAGDKAVVNLTMKKDGVTIEGGEGQGHGIYTSESYYVEGFIDKIMGMKEDETRTFTLKFPKEHYQKHLAGQGVDFVVELKEIFKLETPEIDDAFAVQVGLKDLAELEKKLEENLSQENQMEEDRRQEKEILEHLANKSTFDDIPDLLINQEIEKMISEMKNSVERQGMDFEEYLKSIKKTYADIKIDFAPSALTRVKVALILKEVAKAEKIEINAKKLDHEIEHIAEHYDEKDQKEYIKSPRYREFVEMQMKNKEVLNLLREKMVK